jgi:hypothetical protein
MLALRVLGHSGVLPAEQQALLVHGPPAAPTSSDDTAEIRIPAAPANPDTSWISEQAWTEVCNLSIAGAVAAAAAAPGGEGGGGGPLASPQAQSVGSGAPSGAALSTLAQHVVLNAGAWRAALAHVQDPYMAELPPPFDL